MGKTVIRVEGVSKRYQLGTIGYGSLQHDLMAWWARVRGQEDPSAKIGETSRRALHGDFWALRDVSFGVEQGDRVGIVGRNGAGKSTLLKLLSRVTSPTSGSIKVRGRIASLLEVGTGFHPELTGRENVFLNGAILGMKRREILAKFDEIVEFAGVSQFIDTPVKRYSSGMYVRLAFSVAAHLDSEILIVDEVLAVGDAEFQKKCLGKMEDVSKGQGRTVLFVSHQINALLALCNKGIFLQDGKNQFDGPILEALTQYDGLRTGKGSLSPQWTAETDAKSGDVVSFLRVHCLNSKDQVVNSSEPNNQTLRVVLEVIVHKDESLLNLGLAVYAGETGSDAVWWSCFTDTATTDWPKLQLGLNRLVCQVPPHTLNEGVYRVEVIASIHAQRWIIEPNTAGPAIRLEIRGGLSESPYWYEKRPGAAAPVLKWSTLEDL